MQKSRRRLSAEAWGGMLERFEGSGLPAESFCEQEGISLPSLKRWRVKFRQDAEAKPRRRAGVVEAEQEAAEFVELGALRTGGSRLELRLDFGGGVVLQLSRG